MEICATDKIRMLECHVFAKQKLEIYWRVAPKALTVLLGTSI